MKLTKRPRLRGYPKHLKFAAEIFRRDFFAQDNPAAKARIAALLERLGTEDVMFLKGVVVNGMTASHLEAETGKHNKQINARIRYALDAAARVYAGATAKAD